MRISVVTLAALLGFVSSASAQTTPACTGLCLQQVSCPNGGTTSVSGVVYAPNGTDPLPNVLVYVPNAPVAAFTPGVSCPVVGSPPSGSPLVGATTAVDGSFTIPDVPVGTNIPLVIVSGRWRRQLVIPNVSSCANTALPQGFVSFPQNQSQGDIPKFAIATGGVDSVECVLLKVGISQSEFTDPSGSGRISMYTGDYGPGAQIDSATPSESTLMSNATTLNSYDVLMLPCEGGAYTRPSSELANLVSFANAGGRVYSSHFSYSWMYENPPFNTVVNWIGSSSTLSNASAMVNPNFSGGATLSAWLQDVGASTTPGQIPISTIKHDFNGVNPPTQDWLDLDNQGNPVMQFVFDTPVGATNNQCGRVLFNEYHVETPVESSGNSKGVIFPNECNLTAPITAQEKLLEYSLFELTNDGGAATLAPTSQNFGSEPVGFSSAPQTFTWTNNSTFAASVTLLTGSPDFNVTGNNCTNVPAYGSCSITMVFAPSMLGAETGTLTVGSNGTTLTAALSGTGVPALTLSPATLNFGNLDVGASLTQTVTVYNNASGALPAPVLITTGDYSTTSLCGTSVAAGTSCTVKVIFTPTTTGSRPGTVALKNTGAGTPTTLTGNGIDFTLTAAPASAKVIAGYMTSTTMTTTPLAGFANNVTLSCNANVPGSTCTLSSNSFTPTSAVATQVTITTTSQYTVVGYTGGYHGGSWLWLFGAATGTMLWLRRRSLSVRVRGGFTLGLLVLGLGAGGLGLSGCSGKLPAQNAVYTSPGTYNYTVTATDGFLVHSATYAVTVTAD